ncbi:hypothetical protein CFOL_v3_08496 [Cephalotus follicularis]|uniref:Uncharacterized protein n=1 Tax=Cephalotus follicularis TaxID=3775 RepID=A0A1Q3BAC6_CEPFO|nr:hypothetical protein CFOL_v3_08496 [Cephalotus follicularis]
MSWLRTAVNRAVEAGGRNNITRTVRTYADSVVLHAGNVVAEGTKILQDRIGARNFKSFRHTVKRLEELSVSCRGVERVQLLRRWLVSLKEIERVLSAYTDNAADNGNPDDQSKDSPRKPTLEYYVDPDHGSEQLNFRDVFLHSQALEGITLSMNFGIGVGPLRLLWININGLHKILEAPNDEEVSLLLELFRLCLAGGKEVHNAVINSIQDLATAFSSYKDEVLVKREELLQYAQCAIAGLKKNADLARIDAETCILVEKLDEMKQLQQPLNDAREKLFDEKTAAAVEALKVDLGQIQLCSKLEALLLKKKSLSNGNTPELHAEKVDKLKILSESLISSTSKAEKRIFDHRSQKEEALKFRVAKTNEVSQQEKDLAEEIGQLENQKDELEAELKKVNGLLSAARARLRNAKEEREQFDEASNQILVHLKSKEDELSRSVASCRTEADVVDTWINFLEKTWVLQTNCTEQKEKLVSGELERYGDYFVNLVIRLLSVYKEKLEPSITHVHTLVEKLQSSEGSKTEPILESESPKVINRRKNLEEEYLDIETKFVTASSVVDTMKQNFYAKNEGVYRKDGERIKELFDALEKIKEQFDSIERPILEVETPIQRSQSPSSDSPQRRLFSKQTSRIMVNKTKSSSVAKEKTLDTEAELEKLKLELAEGDNDHLTEEIHEWEFDELEKDLKPVAEWQ